MWDLSGALPNSIRRYDRLKICATIRLPRHAKEITRRDACRYAASGSSDLFRHDKRRAIIPPQEPVGFGILHELFPGRIKPQLRADPQRSLLRIHADGLRVLQQRHDALADDRVVTEILRFFERTFFGDAIGDVAQMTERAGKMPFMNIRREVFALSASDAVDEVLEVSALGGVVIDLGQRFAIAFAARKELAVLDHAGFEEQFVGDLVGIIL